MLIEDPEGFKTWLTSKLEPLCDADPAALAKYVYALVKKDKPVDELKVSMLDQLEVFLQKETKGFVDLLFETLETGDFEIKPVVNEVPASAPIKPTVPDIDLRENILVSVQSQPQETDVKKEAHKELSTAMVASAQNSNSFGSVLLAAASGRKEPAQERHSIRKSESDKEERGVRGRGRRRGSSISPDRRRSRSYDRRRSRSRDRDRSRAWRNKSPPLRRYDRRRSYSKSPVRRHTRSRSPPPSKRGRYRNRSPPRSHSPSITPTPSSNIDREMKLLLSPGRDGQRDTDLRLPVSQNLTSVVNVASDNKSYPAKRCRDFDEKGFCMRGDLCPYDHGSDPVVLEDIPTSVMYNGATATTAPTHPSLASQLLHSQDSPPNSLEYNPAAPALEPRTWRRYYRTGPLNRGMSRGMLGARGGIAGGNVGGGFSQKRELISLVAGSPEPQNPLLQATAPFRISRSHENNHVRESKRFEPYSRANSRRVTAANAPTPNILPNSNTTLQLKKVPPHYNNITHLNNHFAKFGKIVNILVGYEGDSEAALITFSNHIEANSAYKSTEAVLNNRFIKVFWYNPNNNNNNIENKQENIPPANRPSVLERLGAPPIQKVLHSLQPSTVMQQEERVTMSNNNISKTIYVSAALKKEATPSAEKLKEDIQKKKVDEEALKEIKKKQEARKERLKMNAELRKRKQVLLEKQINQQKLLIQRLESGTVKGDQKPTIMSTIKSLQDSIEKLKKDLAEDVEASLNSISNKKPNPKESLALFNKTKEETQRELLDAELDLLKQEQQGKDIVELKKKISDLKMKAFQLKLPILRNNTSFIRGRGAFRARSGTRGRGGAAAAAAAAARFTYTNLDYNVVDHRPTKLLVSGYEEDDKAEVLAHFNQFGEIVNYTSDDVTPSLVLNFKSRKVAEVALSKGRNFQDRLLSVTWATPNHNIRPGITTQNTPIVNENEISDDILESAEDEDEIVGMFSPSESLLLQDEEEDEEEERTWRR